MHFTAPILVTGSAGRLGREIVLLLRHHGYSVLGADLVASPTTDVVLAIRDAAAVSCIEKAQRRLGYAPQYTPQYLLQAAVSQARCAAS